MISSQIQTLKLLRQKYLKWMTGGGSTEFQEREDVELITYINCIQTLSNREDTEVFSAIWAGNLCITKVRGEYLKGQYNNQTNLCIGDCSSTSDQL